MTMTLVSPRNVEEKRALAQFRDEVQDLDLENDVDDHFLLKWLRARELNVGKAKEMLSNYLNWMQSYEGNKGLADWIPPTVVTDNIKFKFVGNDSDGRPVLWLPVGRFDPRKIIEAGEAENCSRYLHQCLQLTLRVIEEQKQLTEATQIVLLADVDQLSFHKVSHLATIQLLLAFFREFESYYPEILYKAFVVNAPLAFSWIFKVIKPILSGHTLGKIQIFSFDAKKWKPVLLENIPASTLPEEYGGTGPAILPQCYDE